VGTDSGSTARSEFPLGELSKDDVRSVARLANLPLADKPESMELCFVPNAITFNLSGLFARARFPLANSEGEIVSEDGVVVGRHGACTILRSGSGKAWGSRRVSRSNVVAIDRENNRVVVGDDDSLRTATCEVQDVNWISLEVPSESLRASVKIRHKHVPAEATITALDATRVQIVFDTPRGPLLPGRRCILRR